MALRNPDTHHSIFILVTVPTVRLINLRLDHTGERFPRLSHCFGYTLKPMYSMSIPLSSWPFPKLDIDIRSILYAARRKLTSGQQGQEHVATERRRFLMQQRRNKAETNLWHSHIRICLQSVLFCLKGVPKSATAPSGLLRDPQGSAHYSKDMVCCLHTPRCLRTIALIVVSIPIQGQSI